MFLCLSIAYTAKRRRSAVGPNVADGVKKLKMSFLTPSFFFGQGVWGLTAKEKEEAEKRREKRAERNFTETLPVPLRLRAIAAAEMGTGAPAVRLSAKKRKNFAVPS